MIRLQCYEGLDESKALYEWQYGKQLLYTQVLKEKLGDLMDGATTLDQSMQRLDDFEDVFFSEQFLQTRPLLQALRAEAGTVLLIDEIDKSDDEFEAFCWKFCPTIKSRCRSWARSRPKRRRWFF